MEQKLGDLTVPWLTKFFKKQLDDYPIQFVPTFSVDELTVVHKLTVGDQVTFASQGWRYVGSAGQPAFSNSWVNYGSPKANASFLKGPDGFVRLRGTIKSGTINTAAFTLPPGYRPATDENFAAVANGAFGELQVGSDGTVKPISGSTTSFSLSGITFKAA